MSFRVGVTGGRTTRPTEEQLQGLTRWVVLTMQTRGEPVLVHGGASGVDSVCAERMESQGVPAVEIPAPWEPMRKLLGEGDTRWKTAGHLRNWQLVRAINVLIHFPGGRGTADCVRRAERAGVPTLSIDEVLEIYKG